MRFKSVFDNNERNFYLLFTLTVVSVFFTNPLLIYPYDVYTHLQWIDIQNNAVSVPKVRYVWHYVWANIFHFLHIETTQIFLRAYVIHFTQVLTSFFILFYFSRVIIRNLFIKSTPIESNYLAYWATIIWFTVFATYSVNQHQVWILWYSVNYQISLPFTLLITGLSVSLALEHLSLKIKIIYILLILLFSYVILRIHPMEYIYYLMYMGILFLIFIDKFIGLWKKNRYYSIPLTLAAIFILTQLISFAKSSSYHKSSIVNYLSFEKLPELLSKIHTEGRLLVNHLNRASVSINELIYLSLFLIVVMCILVLYRHYKKYPSYVNIRIAIFLLITSFFVLIPLSEFAGGLASIVTYTAVVHRFYYSALLFLVIPGFIFYILTLMKIKNLLLTNLAIVLVLLGVFFYSKYISTTHNYYKNSISIKNAFNKEKMKFNLSNKEIEIIGEKIQYYESLNNTHKKIMYYARDDIAFVIKFIYRKPVLYYSRGSKNYLNSYHSHKKKEYSPILFKTPKGFPSYVRYK